MIDFFPTTKVVDGVYPGTNLQGIKKPCINHRENAGTLGWYPSCLTPPRSPLKGDIPNKYHYIRCIRG